MNLLLTALLATSLRALTSTPPMAVEPDSGSVAFTTASVWLRVSPATRVLHNSEADLALLMAEHRLSLQLHLLDDSVNSINEALTGH
jgi:hypothetical protein